MTGLTLGEIADQLGLECHGQRSRPIRGLATLASAGPDQLSFLANRRYASRLATTAAGAVLVAPDQVGQCPVDSLVADDPYLAYARASHFFERAPRLPAGVHPSAVVAPSAQLGEGVAVGPLCVVGEQVELAAGVQLGAGCVVGDRCRIGADTRLHARVTLYHEVVIGARCVVHSGAVLGADGFGFAPDAGHWMKIAQLGRVVVGDDVEIGANTTIDRGALDDTRIGAGVIIDNQVQIAHNVVIGDHTAIAGCVGIAGSARIGRHCTLAGGVGLVGHIEIGDRVHVSGMTMVTKSIAGPGSWSSGTPVQETRQWKRNAVRFAQLDEWARRLSALEKQRQTD